MPKLWKKTGSAKNNSDLVEIEASQLTVSGPTVVYFPGQLTSDNNRDFISIDLNDINELFQGLPSPPQVYLSSLPETPPQKSLSLSSLFRAAVHNFSFHRLPKPTANDASSMGRRIRYHFSRACSSSFLGRDLAKALVMPLVSNAAGRRVPYGEAQKNLRNLTFMGYSIGNLTAQEIYNAAKKMMRKAGYSKKETRQLLQEIVFVSIGSVAEPRQEAKRYTTVSLIYQDDRFVRGKDKTLHPLRGIFAKSSRHLKIKQLSGSSIVLSAAARGRWRNRKKETPEVIDNVQLPRWDKMASNHLFVDYVNTNDAGSLFSRIAQHVLINAADRKDTVNPLDLLTAPSTLAADTRASYQRKIQQARCG